jgi:hypothetical protein
MADLIAIDTDEEIDKYNEATLIAGNPPPLDMTKDKMSVYNPLNGRNDIVVPMSLGGYVKLGEEPVDRITELQGYAKSLSTIGSGGFDALDLEAAGYSAEEIEQAGVISTPVEKSGRTKPLTESEVRRLGREGSDIVEPYRMFMRDDWNRDTVDLMRAIGVPQQQADQIADFFIGQVDTSGGTGIFDSGIAVADFTPIGFAMGVEEVVDQLKRSLNTGDKFGIGFGLLFLALSAAEAYPLTKAGAKAIKQQIPGMRSALIDLGKQADARMADRAGGTTLFSGVDPTAVTDPLVSAAGRAADAPEIDLPPASNSQKTQIAGTLPTYEKADKILDDIAPGKQTLDFGAGLGLSQKKLGYDTYEPFPKEGFDPTFINASEIPDSSYSRVTNFNVLNVVPRKMRDEIVLDIGRVLEDGGVALITTRGRDVMTAKGTPGPEPMSQVTSIGTYQKGFTQTELQEYITQTLGAGFEVTPLKLGPAGVKVKKVSSAGLPGRISTRLPTAKAATEDPLTGDLVVGLEEMKADPKLYEFNVNITKDYPNMRVAPNATVDETSEQFITHVKDNLLYLHDKVPEGTRVRSQKWYDGARAITDRWQKEYGVPDTSIAGALAALSPQKDWYQNVSLARRTLDVLVKQRDFTFSPEMLATFEGLPSLNKPAYQEMRKFLDGKTYAEISHPDPKVENGLKAMFVRLYDQTYNKPDYPIVGPEGDFLDLARTKSGNPKKAAWGSLNEIGKAVAAIEANGDVNIISPLMGERHKVRNFYNNIYDPNSPLGDVTIDTHAVAAGLLRPLSGNALEVDHNFKNMSVKGRGTTKGSAKTGVSGNYGLYAEAYRRAAAERGIQPRQMQSITWEAVRGLFTDTFKANSKNVAEVDAIWQRYKNGEIELDETRRLVDERADGINPPTWE